MKPWYMSKTIWINVLTVLVTSITIYEGVMPQAWLAYIVPGLAVVNVILRFLTTGQITVSSTGA